MIRMDYLWFSSTMREAPWSISQGPFALVYCHLYSGLDSTLRAPGAIWDPVHKLELKKSFGNHGINEWGTSYLPGESVPILPSKYVVLVHHPSAEPLGPDGRVHLPQGDTVSFTCITRASEDSLLKVIHLLCHFRQTDWLYLLAKFNRAMQLKYRCK